MASSTVADSWTATTAGDMRRPADWLGILEQLLDVLGLLVLHQVEDLLGLLGRQLLDDVGGVLGRHPIQDA